MRLPAPPAKAKPYARAAWGFFAFWAAGYAALIAGGGDLYSATDPDNLMRLARVRDWMNGGDWYAMTAPQLGWGGDTYLPWSRLVDLPLAVLAFLFRLFMSLPQALQAAGLIVPPALLALALMPLAARMTSGFIPVTRRYAGSLMLFALAGPMLAQFAPARVDHHAYQIVIAGGSFVLLRRLLRAGGLYEACGAALLLTLGLWIGGESLPVLSLFVFCLGSAAVWRGGRAQKNALFFGLALIVCALALWPVARPVWNGDDFALTWFSGAYVLFAVLCGLVLAAIGGGKTASRPLRAAFSCGIALLAAAAFFRCVPQALCGPFANLPVDSARQILPFVAEAQPLLSKIQLARSATHQLGYGLLLLPILLGLGTSLYDLARGVRRIEAGLSALYISVFLCAALFWQFRVISFAQLFALPAFTRFVLRAAAQAEGNATGRAAYWRRCGTFLALTFGLSAVVPLLVSARPVYPDAVFFLSHGRTDACGHRAVWAALSDPAGLGARPLRIATSLNDGAGVAFFTPHLAMSAPYGVPTNGAALAFFSAADDETAHGIAQREKLDIVAVCRKMPAFYLSSTAPMGWEVEETDATRSPSTLAERLGRGAPPAWLEPVAGFQETETRLYRIKG